MEQIKKEIENLYLGELKQKAKLLNETHIKLGESKKTKQEQFDENYVKLNNVRADIRRISSKIKKCFIVIDAEPDTNKTNYLDKFKQTFNSI